MSGIIGFPLENGIVWVEVEEAAVPIVTVGESEASRAGEVATQVTQTFQEAIESVKPVAETLIKVLDKISDRPDEINVEFGLNLNGKIGTVIAASGVEANFKVSLKWKHE